MEEFESLHSLARSVLPKARRKPAFDILASALSVALRRTDKEPLVEIFGGARKFIISQIISSFRISLFLISLSATIVFFLTLLILHTKYYIGAEFTLAAGSGVIGAMISSLQRNNETSIDPYTSKTGLYSECLSRLLIGSLFGLLIIVLAKSELALSPFKENLYSITFFAFLAGFSERFVPELIASISTKTDKPPP